MSPIRRTESNLDAERANVRHAACDVVELDGYPYPCIAADEYPNDVVMRCNDHHSWWHFPRP